MDADCYYEITKVVDGMWSHCSSYATDRKKAVKEFKMQVKHLKKYGDLK